MNNNGNLIEPNIKVGSPGKAFAKFFFITFILIIILGVAALTVFNSFLDKQILDKGSSSSSSSATIGELIPAEGMFTTDSEFVDSKRINVLLLGETKEQLSDTIMVASYDPETKNVEIISVPRDTYHEREGYTDLGAKKINAAYWGDPVRSAQAVHEVLLGMPINYYAIIGYEGVANIVDAIGGVEVDIPFDMNYEKHSEDPPLIIHLQAGKQTLSGEDAVGYLRYRSGYRDGDLGRVSTQREFVSKAIKQCLGPNLPKVAGSVIENVDSDITMRTVLSLAGDMGDISSDSVNTYVLPGNSNTYEKASFFFCDEIQTEEMLRAIYSGSSFEATETNIISPYDEKTDLDNLRSTSDDDSESGYSEDSDNNI